MHPFDRFTPNAKLALQLAEQLAKNMKSSYIGTEHLLLGLLSIPQSQGFSILSGAGVTEEKIRVLLKTKHGLSEFLHNVLILLQSGRSTDIEGRQKKNGMSTHLHTVIEQSVITPHQLRHEKVGTEHLLHALLTTGTNAATLLLENKQVDPRPLKGHIKEWFSVISERMRYHRSLLQSSRTSPNLFYNRAMTISGKHAFPAERIVWE